MVLLKSEGRKFTRTQNFQITVTLQIIWRKPLRAIWRNQSALNKSVTNRSACATHFCKAKTLVNARCGGLLQNRSFAQDSGCAK
jgi:hypothetical protein